MPDTKRVSQSFRVQQIWSGCQTGADLGALLAAEELGIKTSGYMPWGARTDTGPRPDLLRRFGLRQTPSAAYPPRTRENVRQTDATLWFGIHYSPGCILTLNLCKIHCKPYLLIPFPHDDENVAMTQVDDWINDVGPAHLNVAGNRERTNPGIQEWVRNLLLNVL